MCLYLRIPLHHLHVTYFPIYLHEFSARWRLSNQQTADEVKISELERSIQAATVATQESEWKYEEVLF